VSPDGLTSTAVFGAFDGTTSVTGVLAGLLLVHVPGTTILSVTTALAVASMVGMGCGNYLGGASARHAVVMGLATFGGSLLPAIPLAMTRSWAGYAGTAALITALAIAIAESRAEDGRIRAYVVTMTTIVISCGLAVISAFIVGIA
jgi:hypothetical protein